MPYQNPKDIMRIRAAVAKKKAAQPKPVFKVWIIIEQYDPVTESGVELDAPGAELRIFETYEEAYAFAEQLTATPPQPKGGEPRMKK